MKNYLPQIAACLILAVGVVTGKAGTIFYQAIPATQSDTNSGISSDNQYTSAVDGGNARGTDRVINGITLYALNANGQTATADNCTLNALAGNLSNAGGESPSIQADGVLKEVESDMTFNNGAPDDSQQEIVLDPESLEAGTTYDLRIYICNPSGRNRLVNLSFVGDGQPAVETGFFNEDDARTSPGGFKDPNQAYYIDYRFTWDGDSTPGVTITQKSGSAPFLLYALTNQVVPGGAAEAAPEEQGGVAEGEAGAAEGEGVSTGLVSQESDEIGVASDDFYGSDSLNNNGHWVSVQKWGKCWQPTNVPSGWCPYTNGNFQQCDDCGWTFVSDEPWAWACYHYGRWLKVSYGCGWCWVPGKVWAPSWVSWRQGRDSSCDCIGWAPLPPTAGCEFGVGVSTWVDETCDIGPDCYTFIGIGDFGRQSYFGCGCIYDQSRNITVISQTINITNISYTHFGTYCGGPDYNWCNAEISKHGGQQIDRIHIDRFADSAQMGGKFSHKQGNQLGLLSPHIKGEKHPKHDPKVAGHISDKQIDHGWKGVKDPSTRKKLKNDIAQQNHGKNPKNTKATLPAGVAQKFGKHGGTGAGKQGITQGGKGQHPGQKGQKGVGAGKSLTGGKAGGGGFNQHPGGKKGKQGQGAGAGAAGTAGTGKFNQHPGKGGKGQGAGGAGTKTAGGGGGKGGHLGHPGQPFKGQGGGGAKGTGGGAGKLTGGGQHPGKGKGKGVQGGGNIQGGTGRVGGKGQNKGKGQGTAAQGGQGFKKGGQTGQGGGGGRVGGKGQNKGKGQGTAAQGGQGFKKGGQTGQGGGGGGKVHAKQQQFQQQRKQGAGGGGGGVKQQQFQQQQRHQGAGAGAGGGGGGGGKGKAPKPTPTPRRR